MSIKDQSKIKIGDKVCYQPDHYDLDQWDNGIVKEIPDDSFDHVRVVFHCADNWDSYQEYTGALTSLDDLNIGWES